MTITGSDHCGENCSGYTFVIDATSATFSGITGGQPVVVPAGANSSGVFKQRLALGDHTVSLNYPIPREDGIGFQAAFSGAVAGSTAGIQHGSLKLTMSSFRVSPFSVGVFSVQDCAASWDATPAMPAIAVSDNLLITIRFSVVAGAAAYC